MEALVTQTVMAEAGDLPRLYDRMRDQRLLRRVVKGAGTYAEFLGIHERCGPFCLEALQSGEVACFWWITQFYAQAVCFHGCVFKPYRRFALSLWNKIRCNLFAAGATDIFVFTDDACPEIGRLCARAGLRIATRIGNHKETVVWAADREWAACSENSSIL